MVILVIAGSQLIVAIQESVLIRDTPVLALIVVIQVLLQGQVHQGMLQYLPEHPH